MNFGELKDVVIAKAVPITSTDLSVNINEAFIGAMVNEAYHKIERLALWKFSEAETTLTVSSGNTTPDSTPSDFGIPLTILNTVTDTELRYVDARQVWMEDDASGKITDYYIFADTLTFYPEADSDQDLTMRYYKVWPDLSADGDEPILPSTWHDLITDYATWKTILRLPATGDRFLPNSRAEPFRADYEQGIRELLSSPLVLHSFDRQVSHAMEDFFSSAEHW